MPDEALSSVSSSGAPSRVEVVSEALTLLLEGSLPRLVLLLVWLGYADYARQLLALQASLLGVLMSPRKRRSA